MAAVHGRKTGVLVDHVDLSPYLNAGDVSKSQDTHDVTPYGPDDKIYIGGHEDATMTLGGFWDGDPDAVDDVLSGVLGGDAQPVVTWCPGAGAGGLGHMAVLIQGIETAYGVTSPVDGPVTITAAAQANGPARVGGRVAWPLAQIDGTEDGGHIDDLASSAFGGVAHLHLVEFDGTDIDIRLQHTADDPTGSPTWADLVAWEGLDAVGGHRDVVTGTVQRYLRVVCDGGSFDTATFAVAFARNRR